MAIVWIAMAIVLIAVELHHLAFFAMFGAVGAAGAAVVAAVAPTAYVTQVLVGAALATVGLVAVRPYISEAFAKRGAGATIRGVHGGLVGARGVTLDEVTPTGGGHVRLLGESWLAANADFDTIPPATPVLVLQVVGTTLTVRAVQDFEELS